MSRYLRAGRTRFEYKRLIQRYIDRSGMTQKEFAQSLGISRQVVSRVLNGQGHSPLVIEGLRKIGVPEKLICDPRREEAAA